MLFFTISVRVFIEQITQELEPWYESRSHAQRVSWWLLEKLTGKTMTQLIVDTTITLTNKQHKELKNWIHAHTQEYYPLHYVLGTVPFGPLDLLVEPPTLIPRPETEEWCAHLLNTMLTHIAATTPLRILDLCTGSGCIALWFAKTFPHATVWGVDIADSALSLAKKNAARNNLFNVHFLKSDLFCLLNQDSPFDLIISNPPYVSATAWHELSETITRWEDRGALVADNNGLALIIQIVAQAPHYLKKHSELTKQGLPRLVVEIGFDQKVATENLFVLAGFDKVRTLTDSNNRDRVVIGL